MSGDLPTAIPTPPHAMSVDPPPGGVGNPIVSLPLPNDASCAAGPGGTAGQPLAQPVALGTSAVLADGFASSLPTDAISPSPPKKAKAEKVSVQSPSPNVCPCSWTCERCGQQVWTRHEAVIDKSTYAACFKMCHSCTTDLHAAR